MRALGRFFFRHRNTLFPFVFLLTLFEESRPAIGNETAEHWLMALGIVLAVLGQTLRCLTIGLAYITRGGKNKQVFAKSLVTDGLFAHCRNPLYLGNLITIVGIGLFSNSKPFLLIGIPFFFFAYAAIIAAEEDYLLARFGTAFSSYCLSVNRLIPAMKGLRATLANMRFEWRRVLLKEYQTPFVWIAGMLILLAKDYWLEQGYAADNIFVGLLGLVSLILAIAFAMARRFKKRARIKRSKAIAAVDPA
jgi:protein-S-isoprenylcysteine O-methyltransferase Ste14